MAGLPERELAAARAFSALFRSNGVECEIEATRRGVIAYASTRVDAEKVARSIQRAVLERDGRACVVGPEKDDEQALPWWAEVCFDWRAF